MSSCGVWRLADYRENEEAVWNRVVGDARNGTFLHARSYMDYHAHRFDDASLLIYRKERPVAAFAANREGNRLVCHGGLTFGGLLFGRDVRAEEVLEIFDALAGHWRQKGIDSIVYKSIPALFHRYPAEDDLYALFRQGAQLVRRDLSCVIDLANPCEPNQLRRRSLRKAAANGLVIREGVFFEAFHTLLSEALARHGVSPVHSVEELALLQSRFPEQIRLFGAWTGENLLAASWVFDYGHAVHTQYLASSAEGMESGALDFLLDHLIQHEFAGKRWFSFGISTEQDGRFLNSGLMRYKESFGGRAITHDSYQWNLT
ncbi:GNAT family N-acetyltransferase [Paludibacterium paludis]|uniref:BioF2-like acetyltransferase domain-containing protein n=1 Tax=Paludibacterium paludis TaxID=1225769 RepID=A0A918P7H5_9NEIS|nr:GNAT family N-acetyltransferase [Paludibacterium paludis]GGY27946.1 hypothetical protein GCM10011289_34120 [Paludibacterium paludis]